MVFEWNEEIVETFLVEYQKHECLWNPYHSCFNDCFARNEALKNIVKALKYNVTIKDCLRFLRRIRKKYVKERSKEVLNNKIVRCGNARSKWQNIVEVMFEKIVGDEEQHDATVCPGQHLRKPKLTLYRYPINSTKQEKDRIFIKSAVKGRCKRKNKIDINSRAKLENRNKCCGNVEKKVERNTCGKSDYTKSESAWVKQRDKYLNDLMSTRGNCNETSGQGPGYASHLKRLNQVENIGKNACSSTAECSQGNSRRSNQHVHCKIRTLEGRKRNTDVQPTMTESRCQVAAHPRHLSPSAGRYTKASSERATSTITNRNNSKEKVESHCPFAKNAQAVRTRSATSISDKCSNENATPTCPCSNNPQSSKTCDTPNSAPSDKSLQRDSFYSCPKNPQTSKSCVNPSTANSDKCSREKAPSCFPHPKNQQHSRISETPGTSCNHKHSKEKMTSYCPYLKNSQVSRTCETPVNANKCSKDKSTRIVQTTVTSDKCSKEKEMPRCQHSKNPQGTNDGSGASKAPDFCTKQTCPLYSGSSAVEATMPEQTWLGKRCSAASKGQAAYNKSTTDNSKFVRFEPGRETGSTPRVAARFEDGVLETYSQFKLIFPNDEKQASECPSKSSRRIQTERTSKDCGVSVNRADLDTESMDSLCSSRSRSKKDARSTAGDVDMDFVLLTPGGKYVPLTRTTSNTSEKMYVDDCTCGNRLHEQELEVSATMNNSEKRMQNTLDDEKCTSTTTKLLLCCLEQMLNLEDQEDKGKCVDVKNDSSEACTCKCSQHLEITENAGGNCCKAKQANSNANAIQRGKLTQNFLEIVKCALELDNQKNECEDDGQRQDCECKIECSYVIKCNNVDKSIQCEIIENRGPLVTSTTTQTAKSTDDKCISSQDLHNSYRSTNQNKSTCQGIPDPEQNGCILSSCAKLLKFRPCTSPITSKDINLVYRKCLRCRPKETTVNNNCTCFEEKMEAKLDFDKSPIGGTCVTLETRNAFTANKCSNSLKETHDTRRFHDESDRPTSVYNCNAKRVNRMGSHDAESCERESPKRPSISYVKFNQFNRSFIARSPRRHQEDDCSEQA